jgi:hypothetical protein
MARRFVILVGTATIYLTFTAASSAADYTFYKVVELSDGYTSIASQPAINNSGTVVFGAATPAQQGLFSLTTDGVLTPIAILGEPYVGFGHVGGVDVGTPDINDDGRVAFFAFSGGGSGVFSSDGTTTTTIAHSDGLAINPSQLNDQVSINNSGMVAFSVDGPSTVDGVHVGSGGPIVTIDPSGRDPAINDAGVVAYSTQLGANNSAILTSDGRRIVTQSENQMLSAFPSINNSGVVAFQGKPESTNIAGIYTGAGVPMTLPVVPEVTLVADGSGLITDPGARGNLAINDRGTVAFWSELSGTGGGIFTGPNRTSDKVIAEGDALLDGTVNLVEFSRNGLNDHGQIVFSAQYTKIVDGLPVNSRGIFVADPNPSPAVSDLPGDYNDDGVVDAADYVVWRDNLGQSVLLPNDPSSGVVTQDDYGVWRANFGSTLRSGFGAAVTTVPEPVTVLLIAMALLMSSVTRRSWLRLYPAGAA